MSGRPPRDQAFDHLSVRSGDDSKITNLVAEKASIRQLTVGKIFADGDTTDGTLVVGPTTSQANQIASFVDDQGSVLQASLAVADSAGIVATTGLFVGSDPANSATWIGGIQQNGDFAPRVLNANFSDLENVASSLSGSSACSFQRVGQIVTWNFLISDSGSGTADGVLFDLPAAFVPNQLQQVTVLVSPDITPALLTIDAGEVSLTTPSASGLGNSDTIVGSVTYFATPLLSSVVP